MGQAEALGVRTGVAERGEAAGGRSGRGCPGPGSGSLGILATSQGCPAGARAGSASFLLFFLSKVSEPLWAGWGNLNHSEKPPQERKPQSNLTAHSSLHWVGEFRFTCVLGSSRPSLHMYQGLFSIIFYYIFLFLTCHLPELLRSPEITVHPGVVPPPPGSPP